MVTWSQAYVVTFRRIQDFVKTLEPLGKLPAAGGGWFRMGHREGHRQRTWGWTASGTQGQMGVPGGAVGSVVCPQQEEGGVPRFPQNSLE